MARIYYITNIPNPVMHWFKRNYPNCVYDFFVYYTKKPRERIYGCFVSCGEKLITSAIQADLKWFQAQMNRKEALK